MPLMIAQEAEGGDPFSEWIVMETARYLGAGVVSVAHMIDPDGIVLGGAMNFGGHASPLGRRFLEAVRREMHRLAFPVVAEKVVIDFASLGGDAGYIGAAGIARLAARKKH
jgi:glucokinase